MSETKILGRDDFVNGSLLKRELAEISPGKAVYIRDLGGEGILAFNARVKELKGDDEKKESTPEGTLELMALAVSLSACDESGNLLFTENDIKPLIKNNAALLTELFNKILLLSGLGITKAQELTSEVAANLKNAPTVFSLSDLPKNSKRRKRKS